MSAYLLRHELCWTGGLLACNDNPMTPTIQPSSHVQVLQ